MWNILVDKVLKNNFHIWGVTAKNALRFCKMGWKRIVRNQSVFQVRGTVLSGFPSTMLKPHLRSFQEADSATWFKRFCILLLQQLATLQCSLWFPLSDSLMKSLQGLFLCFGLLIHPSGCSLSGLWWPWFNGIDRNRNCHTTLVLAPCFSESGARLGASVSRENLLELKAESQLVFHLPFNTMLQVIHNTH